MMFKKKQTKTTKTMTDLNLFKTIISFSIPEMSKANISIIKSEFKIIPKVFSKEQQK